MANRTSTSFDRAAQWAARQCGRHHTHDQVYDLTKERLMLLLASGTRTQRPRRASDEID